MNISAYDSPNLQSVSNMSRMFYGASAFNADIGQWNVQNVTKYDSFLVGAGENAIPPNWVH